MHEPYEKRFFDRAPGTLPVMTGVAERSYAAHSEVRFAAGGEYRLLVLLGEDIENNACLLRPGQTVLLSFKTDTTLCDISYQGGGAEQLFAERKTFRVEQPTMIAEAAFEALRVPDGCNASVFRSAQLLRIFSCLPETEPGGEEDGCGKRAMDYIRENYMRPINVNDIAAAVGVSRSWLYRCFMDYAEQSPAMFLRDLRLQRAKSLLQRTSLSVQQIAQAVGYEDPLYFSRVFSEYIGCAPSVYRKSK